MSRIISIGKQDFVSLRKNPKKKIMMPSCWHGEYQKRRADIMDLHLKEKCVDRIVRRY